MTDCLLVIDGGATTTVLTLRDESGRIVFVAENYKRKSRHEDLW